jgi:hypothetical protein
LASAPFATHAFDLKISIQQLVTAFCDRMDVKIKDAGDLGVAATADTQRLQAGVQPALLLIKQAHEEKDGGAHFMGQELRSLSAKRRLDFQPREVLFSLHFRRSCEIDELALDHLAMNAALSNQGQQGFFDFAPDHLAQLR